MILLCVAFDPLEFLMLLFYALHKCFFLSFSSPSFPSMWVNVPANPWWTVETFGMLVFSWAILSHRDVSFGVFSPNKTSVFVFIKYRLIVIAGWTTAYPWYSAFLRCHICFKSATTYQLQHQLAIRYSLWLCDFRHLMSAVTFTMHCLFTACTVVSVLFCILSSVTAHYNRLLPDSNLLLKGMQKVWLKSGHKKSTTALCITLLDFLLRRVVWVFSRRYFLLFCQV